MKNPPTVSRAYPHVPAVFAVVMLIFIMALIWVGVVLIRQDMDLATQRKRDRLDVARERLSSTLSSGINEDYILLREVQELFETGGAADQWWSQIEADSGRVLVLLEEDQLESYPVGVLRYYPTERPQEIADERFGAADRLEFVEQDLDSAVTYLEVLSANSAQAIRGEAIARLARIRNKQGRTDETLALYELLLPLGDVYINAVPASWLGMYGRCAVFERQRRFDHLAVEAASLAALLRNGHFHVTKATYRFYVNAVSDWLRMADADTVLASVEESPLPHPPSEGAIALRGVYLDVAAGLLPEQGYRSVRVDSSYVIIQWVWRGQRLAGFIAESRASFSRWLRDLPADLDAGGIGWSIREGSSGPLSGNVPPAAGLKTIDIFPTTDSPWTITSYEIPTRTPRSETRRSLLLAVLVLVIAIVSISAYYLTRAIQRELKLARLKSDFVSAVSHEFRTPLTSVVQLTELLASGRTASHAETQEYYDTLNREAHRLKRLVESLLNFGRMEAGKFSYAFSIVHLDGVVQATVAEFVREHSLDPDRISVETEAGLLCDVDEETIRLAVWNLLDNAVKYSGEEARVQVKVDRKERHATISVTDRGPGIAQSEQRHVFDTFVRGSEAESQGIPGSGIGLAIVKRIVEDHGGKIAVTSESGRGSTFLLTIPMSTSG
jgi:signal transduction histidine kinase